MSAINSVVVVDPFLVASAVSKAHVCDPGHPGLAWVTGETKPRELGILSGVYLDGDSYKFAFSKTVGLMSFNLISSEIRCMGQIFDRVTIKGRSLTDIIDKATDDLLA